MSGAIGFLLIQMVQLLQNTLIQRREAAKQLHGRL